MTSRPGSRAALVVVVALVAVVLVAGCGSTPGTAAPSAAGARPSTPAVTATAAPVPTSAAQTPSDGGASSALTGGTGVPGFDASWTKAVAHIEITGGRTLTIEGLGSAVSMGGLTSLSFVDDGHTYAVGITISNDETAGVAMTAPNLITGGTFGKDCQLNVTRNEAAELAGTFACTNVEGADPTTIQTFRVDIKGSFSAKP